MVIDTRCFTNIDKYRLENWPDKMACAPRKGDFIAAESGVKLIVVDITHRINKKGEALLEVELTR